MRSGKKKMPKNEMKKKHQKLPSSSLFPNINFFFLEQTPIFESGYNTLLIIASYPSPWTKLQVLSIYTQYKYFVFSQVLTYLPLYFISSTSLHQYMSTSYTHSHTHLMCLRIQGANVSTQHTFTYTYMFIHRHRCTHTLHLNVKALAYWQH